MYSIGDLQKLAGPFPPERLLELEDYLMQSGESYAPAPAWRGTSSTPSRSRTAASSARSSSTRKCSSSSPSGR
jgi:hypothetical protein